MALTKIASRVRGAFAGNYPENREDEQSHINSRGDTLVAQALPERADLVRLGLSYVCFGTTQLALSTGMPIGTCSTGHLVLWNGEIDGGRSYIIDSIGFSVKAVGAQTVNVGLAAQLNLGRQTNPAGALGIKALNGRANYAGRGNAIAGFPVTNDGWRPVGTSLVSGNAAANAMLSVEYWLNGLYIMQPGFIFSVVALANTTSSGPACQPFITFHEAQLSLG